MRRSGSRKISLGRYSDLRNAGLVDGRAMDCKQIDDVFTEGHGSRTQMMVVQRSERLQKNMGLRWSDLLIKTICCR